MLAEAGKKCCCFYGAQLQSALGHNCGFYHKMRYFSVNWKRATPDFWGVSPRDPLDPRGQKNTFFSFFEIFTVQRARKNHGLLGLRRRNPNPGNLIQTFQLRLGRWAMSRAAACCPFPTSDGLTTAAAAAAAATAAI